ncbi:MAG: DUF6542 domain-containing protein [Corynebacterium sp.]|nr:DUF6542 domain-containing protein [Corynebacterium sp.]
MSHVKTPTSLQAQRAPLTYAAFPVWLSVAVVIASLITGGVISTLTGSISWAFVVIFGLGAIAATLLVEVRGLFLTVAAIPFLIGAGTLITSFAVTSTSGFGSSSSLSRTQIITSVYPLLEVFPPLLIISCVCVILALVRISMAKQHARSVDKQTYLSRQQTAAAEKRNRESSSRARQTVRRLTVAELVERNRKQKPADAPSAASSEKRPADRLRTRVCQEPSRPRRTSRYVAHNSSDDQTSRARVRKTNLEPHQRPARSRMSRLDNSLPTAASHPRFTSSDGRSTELSSELPRRRRQTPDPHRRAGDTPVYRPRRANDYIARKREESAPQRPSPEPHIKPDTPRQHLEKHSRSTKPSSAFDKDLYTD